MLLSFNEGNILRKFLFAIPLVILALSTISPYVALASQEEIPITVDPRVELMSLIFRLAGNQEYNKGKVPSYLADADRHFRDFRTHKAIILAEQLRQEYGIGYDAVVGLALHVSNPPGLEERIPLESVPGSLDQRWTVAEARAFLKEARKFAEESRFMDFYSDHNDLYSITQDRMKQVIQSREIISWFEAYFGTKAESSFTIDLGMFNGGNCYGPHFSSPGNPDELHSIIGVWEVDAQGLPVFSSNMNNTIVHEFSHSFINPLVGARKNTMQRPGAILYSLVSEKMKAMAYGNWKTMIDESLVRAVSIRWLATSPKYQTVPQQLKRQQQKGFYWMPGLNNLLMEFENSRDKYSNFEQFLPVIEEFFSSYSDGAEKTIAAVEAEWAADLEEQNLNSPQVVGMQPTNFSIDVDPSLTEITFTFDRSMRDQQWSVMDTGEPFPTITGKVSYNEDKTIFTMPVSLKPGNSYGFSLNSSTVDGFSDQAGNKLVPYIVHFQTRGQ